MIPNSDIVAARILSGMSSLRGDATLRESVIATWGPNAEIVGRDSLTSTGAAVAIRQQSGDLLIFCLGVNGELQGRRFYSGYFPAISIIRRNYHGFHEFGDKGADDVLDFIPNSWFLGVPRARLFGHSGGGVVVEALTARMMGGGLAEVIETVTYGSPKASLPGTSYGDLPDGHRRYMNMGDPIPAVPYISQVGVGELLIVGASTQSSPWTFVHTIGGILVSGAGRIVRQEPFLNGPAADQIELLRAGDPNLTALHSIAGYVRVLMRADTFIREHQMFPDVGRVPMAPSAPNEPNFVLPLELTPEPGFVVPIAFATVAGAVTTVSGGRSYDSLPRRVTQMAMGRITRSWYGFTFVRVGKEYHVFLMQDVIATTTTRGAARTMCRAGNRFLRAMGNRASWSAGVLPAKMAEWMVQAAAGTGYSPPLRVS